MFASQPLSQEACNVTYCLNAAKCLNREQASLQFCAWMANVPSKRALKCKQIKELNSAPFALLGLGLVIPIIIGFCLWCSPREDIDSF